MTGQLAHLYHAHDERQLSEWYHTMKQAQTVSSWSLCCLGSAKGDLRGLRVLANLTSSPYSGIVAYASAPNEAKTQALLAAEKDMGDADAQARAEGQTADDGSGKVPSVWELPLTTTARVKD